MSVSPAFRLGDEPLILASASPRRAQMLREAGIPFVVIPADIDEHCIQAESTAELPEKIALAKAESIARLHPNRLVLAADTIVCLGDVIFGKPRDMADAVHTLQQLSGKTHQVITGVALLQGNRRECWHAVSDVTFKTLTLAEIQAYFAQVNPLDKAGAYAIQEHGEMIISAITGLRSNIVGLPIEEVLARIAR